MSENTTDKLYFEKATALTKSSSFAVRVDPATYNIISSIADKTALNYATVIRKMIQFAENHIEFID